MLLASDFVIASFLACTLFACFGSHATFEAEVPFRTRSAYVYSHKREVPHESVLDGHGSVLSQEGVGRRLAIENPFRAQYPILFAATLKHKSLAMMTAICFVVCHLIGNTCFDVYTQLEKPMDECCPNNVAVSGSTVVRKDSVEYATVSHEKVV
jgi:hypothetical protein